MHTISDKAIEFCIKWLYELSPITITKSYAFYTNKLVNHVLALFSVDY